jgi:hypothetical protein
MDKLVNFIDVNNKISLKSNYILLNINYLNMRNLKSFL